MRRSSVKTTPTSCVEWRIPLAGLLIVACSASAFSEDKHRLKELCNIDMFYERLAPFMMEDIRRPVLVSCNSALIFVV